MRPNEATRASNKARKRVQVCMSEQDNKRESEGATETMRVNGGREE